MGLVYQKRPAYCNSRNIAFGFLAHPASYVQIERAFGKAGQVIAGQRSMLGLDIC